MKTQLFGRLWLEELVVRLWGRWRCSWLEARGRVVEGWAVGFFGVWVVGLGEELELELLMLRGLRGSRHPHRIRRRRPLCRVDSGQDMLFWSRRESVRFSLASLATLKCGEMPRKSNVYFIQVVMRSQRLIRCRNIPSKYNMTSRECKVRQFGSGG